MDNIIKKKSLLIGLAGAVLAACIYIYLWKYKQYSNGWLALIIYFAPIALGIIAQLISKKSVGSMITMKQCVLAYFIVILLFFISEAVVNYLIFVIIDPDAQEIHKEFTLKAQQANPNAAATSKVFKGYTYSIGEYFTAIVSKTLLYTVIGILSGFIIRNVKTTN